jgi:uncharacterized membrane protein YeaQ/YmgE (transglycosylase-associated protein family)
MVHFFGISISNAFLAWILIGLLAGWLAGLISRGGGFGCLGDILIGLIGSVLGGWIFLKLGIGGGGFVYSLAAATVGAVLLVVIVRLLTGGRHPR